MFIRGRLNDVTLRQRRLLDLDYVLRQGRGRYVRKARFEALRQEYGQLVREIGDAATLSPELRFAQRVEWLAPDDPRIKREVAQGEPGYGWTRRDEGGFKRLTWIAENEELQRDYAELATRDRPSATTVKPLWKTGPNVQHQPYAPDPDHPPVERPPARLTFDFRMDDEDPANDGW